MRKLAVQAILLLFILCQSFNSISQIQNTVQGGTVVFSPEEIDD